jgi:AcrR family transcriptional regulator
MSVARRKRRGDYHHGDLRNALLGAAWSALEGGGVERLSLRELAQTLGVSYAAPAHHFPDKEDLLDELRRVAWTRFADALESALAGKGATLREVGHAYIGFALDHAHALRLMFKPSARGPTAQVLAESRRAWEILLRAVATQLAASRPAGERELAAFAVAAWAQVHGLAMLWTDVTVPPEMREPGAAQRLRAAAIEVVIAGIDAIAASAGKRRGTRRGTPRGDDPALARKVRTRRPGRRGGHRSPRRSPRRRGRQAAR